MIHLRLLTLVFPLLSLAAMAQPMAHHTVYFDHNSSTLSKKQRQKLDSLVAALPAHPTMYYATVEGHTDADGTHLYNEALSFKRANAVKIHLKEIGLHVQSAWVSAKGEQDPVSMDSTEEAKAANRRVEIDLFWHYTPPNVSDKWKKQPEKGIINGATGGSFTAASGSIIQIPDHAFVDHNGEPVTGDVDIAYTEFRNAEDFLFSDISMYHRQEGQNFHFQSAGMFEFRAYQDNQPLEVATGKSIKVQFNEVPVEGPLSFYAYNEESRTWTEQRAIRGDMRFLARSLAGATQRSRVAVETANNALRHKAKACPVCELSKEQSTLLLYDFGRKLINSGEKPNVLKSLCDEAIANNTSIEHEWMKLRQSSEQTHADNAQERLQKAMHPYTVSLRRRNPVCHFSLNTSAKGKSIETIHLKNTYFKCSTNPFEHLGHDVHNTKWDYLHIEKDGIYYTVTLATAADTLRIEKCTLHMKGLLSRFQTEAIKSATMERYMAHQLRHQQRIAALRDTIAQCRKRMELRKDSIDHYTPADTDTYPNRFKGKNGKEYSDFFCFWATQQSMMGRPEKSLGYDKWWSTFDLRTTYIAKRVGDMASTPDFEKWSDSVRSTLPEAKWRDKYLPPRRNAVTGTLAWNSQELTNPAMDSAFIALTINTTGIFNCDQISRLQSPVLISACYKDANGAPLDIIRLDVLDAGLNGVLVYNGYLGYGPRSFVLSAKNRSLLFAIDTSGKVWHADTESIEQMKKQPKNLHTITLRPLKDARHVEDLKKALASPFTAMR